MRIALFTTGIYPLIIGGMQKHSYYLAKYLAKNGVHVDLYYLKPSKMNNQISDLFTPDERIYIRTFDFEFPKSVYFPGHYIYNSYRYSNILYNKFIENKKVDFVYAQGFSAWKLISMKKKYNNGIPVGVNFHGFNMFQSSSDYRRTLENTIYRHFVRSILHKSDAVFSLGGYITDIIKSEGINSKKIYYSPNGIESLWITSKVRVRTSCTKFVFVGRYEKLKGIEIINSALKMIGKQYNYEFHFIGPIPENKRILTENTFYHGKIDDSNSLKNILQGCDILVCPSYSEGVPTVILEGMARGLAVIATSVGGIPELVSSNNGWLIKPGNAIELRDTITDAITMSNSKLHEKKNKSRNIISTKYIWENAIKPTINSIRQIINQN